MDIKIKSNHRSNLVLVGYNNLEILPRVSSPLKFIAAIVVVGFKLLFRRSTNICEHVSSLLCNYIY
jgi:hypothetical protein